MCIASRAKLSVGAMLQLDQGAVCLRQSVQKFVELALGGVLQASLGVLNDEKHGQRQGGFAFSGTALPTRRPVNGLAAGRSNGCVPGPRPG